MRRRAGKGDVEQSRHGMRWGRPEKDRGFVLVIVLIIIAALALLGLAASRNMLTDLGIAQNHGGKTKAFYQAEAGAEYGYNQFYQYLKQVGAAQVGNTSYTGAQAIPGCTVNVTPAATSLQQKITSGSFKGLQSWTRTFTITASYTDSATNAQSVVAMDVVNTLIPIFQFGVFYNSDLEMNPGANLNIPVNGWIHTNSNLYTSTSATETINSNITSAAQIIHGRKDGDPQAVGTGNVSIEGANGTYYNLVNGSDTVSNGNLVSNNQWATTVQQWGGQVSASEEGVQSLTLPLPSGQSSNPEYLLSKTGQGTMGSEAAVFVTNGVATDAKGNTLSTCFHNANYKSGGSLKVDSGCTTSANEQSVTQGTVYDYRNGATADTTDINVAGFQASAAGTALASASNGGTAGVLYATSTASTTGSTYPAVRLTDSDVNGNASIASSGVWWNNSTNTPIGLTVATDLPAYVQGNFNTVNASNGSLPPAAIMSDSTTVLSSQWSNSYNSSTSLSNRNVTSAVTLNADIMTGNQATTSAGYGGGFENFVRFLESWSGQNWNFGGSLVCMWQSSKTTGVWQNTGIYYNPPNRNYNFNVFGTNWPPGIPCFPVVARGTWHQQL